MNTCRLGRVGVAAAILSLVPAPVATADGNHDHDDPQLIGRAVLPVETYAPGPPSGAGVVSPGQTETVINGVHFPTPSQPVEGFSAIVAGRHRGEYLAMPDNGFGGKTNSGDFLIRAYYLTPDFKTTKGGSGTVAVGEYIQFADPDGLIGFPIVRENTPERWLTGGDIDPESLQRDRSGDLWVGDEFGPWILHFDRSGRLLEAPISLPDGLTSPNNPHLVGTPAILNSRGIEAMAITRNGRNLIVVLEGAVVGDDPLSRRIYKYQIASGRFTRLADYHSDVPVRFIADAQALDDGRLVLIERDGSRGATAVARPVYAVDLARSGGVTTKTLVVELAAIPDPDLVSLPVLHIGDVGLGNPFQMTCESIEAVHVVSDSKLMFGCDNNFPNTGRNPALADDSEFILVRAAFEREGGDREWHEVTNMDEA
ncbi:MAG: esterase-like activity of phytase family protein [Ilumatobacteraceae bacterium]